MAKISFDADGTFLEYYKIRQFAKKLVEDGHEVWIVTARYKDIANYTRQFCAMYEIDNVEKQHADLFVKAKWCGIPFDRIHFCDMNPKAEFFLQEQNENRPFLWHLDDDRVEVDDINEYTKTIGINVKKCGNWRVVCNNLIKQHENI